MFAASAPPQSLSAPLPRLSAPPSGLSAPPRGNNLPGILAKVPGEIKQAIDKIGKRTADKELVKEVVVKLCSWRKLGSSEIALILGKSEKYVLKEYIKPLREEGRIKYSIPDMANHPDQKYQV